MANYALVFAQLIIDGDKYGVSPFLVQIRDLETHKWRPGVKSGDLGPKLGYHSKDNGWMQLNNVRIPRDQMLSRFTRVDREGNFSIEGDLRVLYSTMLSTRTAMLNGASNILLPALLIATRYSLIRRQFKNTPGSKKETVILDY